MRDAYPCHSGLDPESSFGHSESRRAGKESQLNIKYKIYNLKLFRPEPAEGEVERDAGSSFGHSE